MPDDRLSRTFAALSNPIRRAILERLAEGEATVTDLAAPFEMSLPAISRHLRILEEAGLISKGRDAQWRPCRLETQPLLIASEWIEQYRQSWEERFVRLDKHLRKMQAKGNTTNEHDDDGSH